MMANIDFSEYEVDRTGGDGRGSGRVKPQDMELMQKRLYETLSYFADFCDKHNLRYILAGGTCIGAVRHHDLVPWDGDVDVALLREDFDTLFELWEKFGDKDNFSLYRTTEDFCSHVSIGLMRNNNTTFIREFEKDVEDTILGVKIDIEPYDEVPRDRAKRWIQKINAYLRSILLTQRRMRKTKRSSKVKRFFVSIILYIFKHRGFRNKILRFTDRQVKKYNGTGCRNVALNGGAWEITKTVFLDRIKVPVRDKELYIPREYDKYLCDIYGDYMQKPPVEARKFGDNPFFYDLNLPFKEYTKSKEIKEQ